jgi:phosphorylase/glycogen(starch) synthase
MTRFANTYLFEVSWEVCNKIGAIHTALESKAPWAEAEFGDNYYLIGPALDDNPEFEETDEQCWEPIRSALTAKHLTCRYGRWRVKGRPRTILPVFANRYNSERLLFQLWDHFGVDSIAGGWDYVEPVLFSTAAGEVIAALTELFGKADGNQFLAHFHEWTSGAGLLHLRENAPEITTIFTIHATALGRAMASSGREIYAEIGQISPAEEAKSYHVQAKHSLETSAVKQADCFTAVSRITASEAHKLLGRKANMVTENGMDIPADSTELPERRRGLEARNRIIARAETLLGESLPADVRLVMTSGNYDYATKGMDVFLESLAQLNRLLEAPSRVLALFFVIGPHLELKTGIEPVAFDRRGICTHRLADEHNDPILSACARLGLHNTPENPVKVIFVPVYLSQGDGVFDMPYTELLQGADVAVFPSKYAPWGYAAMECALNAVPTVTSDQAGFGIWVNQHFSKDKAKGIFVLPRMEHSSAETINELSLILKHVANWSDEELLEHRIAARHIACQGSWQNGYGKYLDAYSHGMQAAGRRRRRQAEQRLLRGGDVLVAAESAQPHFRAFVVEADIPERIARLRELAYNLWWSWHLPARNLFKRIDPHLYETGKHNPVFLLNSVSPQRLRELTGNHSFISQYDQVLESFDNYIACNGAPAFLASSPALSPRRPIAYFSTEFGIHESLPIYSGGLGVLSGDHLKSASDLHIPLVGVGLFYQHGYFRQHIDAKGQQVASYPDYDPSTLPLEAVLDEDGTPAIIKVELPGRLLYAQIWRVNVGRVSLYLLDSNLPHNTLQDRQITAQLYVGDERTRIEQEILLGIGGARALRHLRITPSVYHLNEGHSAFLILENISYAIKTFQLSFDEAREYVCAHTVFTTHTPVKAGNETFSQDLMHHYFASFFKEVGLYAEHFFELGCLYSGENQPFMMTVLALKASYLANGVSRLHKYVSQQMWEKVWVGQERSMVPILHITNGIHVPTFIGPEMQNLFNTYMGLPLDTCGLMDEERWKQLDHIPDELLWDAKNAMKQRLIMEVKEILGRNWSSMSYSREVSRDEVVSKVRSSWLTIGYARRFAPYKRAELLFDDLDRLERIVNDSRRPVQILLAGKAHPKDAEGKELIRRVVAISREKRFAGRILFLENYEMDLAKLLVQGVDVWLNTPRRPYEASGTSGQKAALNAGVNLSVADGWWCEGAAEGNGWTIGPDPEEVDETTISDDVQDAAHLYSLLEDVIVPLYYQRNNRGMPEGWLEVMRRSLKTIVPVFNTHRMLVDYYTKMYKPAAERGYLLAMENCKLSRQLAEWKSTVGTRFSQVQILDIATTNLVAGKLQVGSIFSVKVRVRLGSMLPEELSAMLIVGRIGPRGKLLDPETIEMAPDGKPVDEVVTFKADYVAQTRGNCSYGIRLMPYHRHQDSQEKLGLALWA